MSRRVSRHHQRGRKLTRPMGSYQGVTSASSPNANAHIVSSRSNPVKSSHLTFMMNHAMIVLSSLRTGTKKVSDQSCQTRLSRSLHLRARTWRHSMNNRGSKSGRTSSSLITPQVSNKMINSKYSKAMTACHL